MPLSWYNLVFLTKLYGLGYRNNTETNLILRYFNLPYFTRKNFYNRLTGRVLRLILRGLVKV